MLRYTTDRARPSLVALYDIRPGNGAGPFLQPRSPHGAQIKECKIKYMLWNLKESLKLPYCTIKDKYTNCTVRWA